MFLGAGHLYLGNIATGLILIAWDLLLTVLLFVPIIDIAAVIVWFLSLGAAMLTAGISAGNKNRAVLRY